MTTVVVEEAAPTETPPIEGEIATAAVAVVAAAETAVALVEGQAALANMAAAEVVADATERAEEAVEAAHQTERNTEWLVARVEEMQTQQARMQETLENLLTPQPSLEEPETATLILTAEPEAVEAALEAATDTTTEFSTQNDTSAETEQTQTEHSDASESPAQEAPVAAPAPKRRRWI